MNQALIPGSAAWGDEKNRSPIKVLNARGVLSFVVTG
jgi:hypothetical protein